MKFAYEFEQLCGTVYTQGNLVYTPDGNTLLSPVGNRITMFDLINNRTTTFAFESRSDIQSIAVSNDSRLLVAVDVDGRSLLVNLKRGVVLYRFNFKKPVNVLKFSPDDKYLAVSHGRKVQIWFTPSTTREFAPFVQYRTFTGHHNDILSIEWSHDSKFFVTASTDLTAQLHSIKPYPNFQRVTLAGHRDAVIAAYFSQDDQNIYTVAKDGAVFIWAWKPLVEDETSSEDEDEDDEKKENLIPAIARGVTWYSMKRHVLKMNYTDIVCCSFHSKLNLLVVGFANGTFGIYEAPEMNNIHTLSISQNEINTVAINQSGDWLAFASSKLGQLLVWEWKSETYVLKQQGHFFDLNVLDYSPDGQIVATGSDDNKLKLWNTTTGFCYVTFSQHTGPITGVKFTSNGSAVLSASLDGTVRAFDLDRYKNFRVLSTPNPVQFISLALDPSGQIVCAGTLDPFSIFVWSLQTGRLTDVLSGHEGPVTSLSFSAGSGELMLASASWDHTVRLWNVYQAKSFIEPLAHSHDVLAVAFRPDGKQLCSATLNGCLNFWNAHDGTLIATIEGQRDISGGRKSTDRITAKNNSISKYFTSVCYSADGSCLIAGGESKFVCIYETSQQILLKKFQISHNRSLEGVLDTLHSGLMTDIGPIGLIDDGEQRQSQLPGAKRAVDPGSRRTRLAVRSKAVVFSPTGRSWAVASSEGLLIYSLNENLMFDPFDLDESITPETIQATRQRHEYSKALLMSLHLNEEKLIHGCVEAVPSENIPLVAEALRDQYLQRLLMFLAKGLEQSPHLEYYLTWTRAVLRAHGTELRQQSSEFLSTFRSLQKALSIHLHDLSKLCNDNQYTLDFMRNLGKTN